MYRSIPFLLITILIALTLPTHAQISFQVDLRDGSRLIGVPEADSIDFDVEFDQVKVPLTKVFRLEVIDDSGLAILELLNQDRLTGRWHAESTRMATLFGQVKIQRKHIKQIYVRQGSRGTALPRRDDILLALDFENSHAGVLGIPADATQQGGKPTRAGRRGSGYEFTGDGGIRIPHAQRLCPDAFSVGGWIYPRIGTGSYQTILSKTNPGSWSRGFGIVRMSNNDPFVHFFVNSYTSDVVKAQVDYHRWTHVMGICEGKTIQLYVNGHLAAEKSISAPIQHVNHPICIGSDESNYHWNGILDEFVFYKRALNRHEVLRLFESYPSQN